MVTELPKYIFIILQRWGLFDTTTIDRKGNIELCLEINYYCLRLLFVISGTSITVKVNASMSKYV